MKNVSWVAEPRCELATDPARRFVELMAAEGNQARAAVNRAEGRQAGWYRQQGSVGRHGGKLAISPRNAAVALNFEGRCRGRHPRSSRRARGSAGKFVQRIYGILNGTCNYLLTAQERETAVPATRSEEAQRLG